MVPTPTDDLNEEEAYKPRLIDDNTVSVRSSSGQMPRVWRPRSDQKLPVIPKTVPVFVDVA
jgi:hypothetical protein